ncbi:MAG: thiamine diphosphokinase, partial [Anaerolineaceae bacterium]
KYSMIIVVDRGLIASDKLKLLPDYILGDFDSVPLELLSKYKTKAIPIESYPRMKDKTDTHIALDIALTHKPSSIDIVGATGSRMDHTISNIELLMLALNQGVDARILDENNSIYLKNRSFVIQRAKQHGDYISLIPLSHQVKGLRLHGFKYPLDGITLSSSSSLGVSNELIDEEGRIEFEEGILTVFETKD